MEKIKVAPEVLLPKFWSKKDLYYAWKYQSKIDYN